MGLFDFVDSIFDPTSGSGVADGLLDWGLGQVMGGFSGGQPQTNLSPSYFPPAPTFQPQVFQTAAVAGPVMQAVAAGLPRWSARFPALWQALQKLRAQGSKLSVDKLITALRKWGPTALSGMIGAAAVADLVTYSMTRKRRRMNPANARALRRSMRRLKAFDNLSHRVSQQLSSACRPKRRRAKC